jgi:hypothetical protein
VAGTGLAAARRGPRRPARAATRRARSPRPGSGATHRSGHTRARRTRTPAGATGPGPASRGSRRPVGSRGRRDGGRSPARAHSGSVAHTALTVLPGYAVGQRRRFSCPTRRSSPAKRWRSARSRRGAGRARRPSRRRGPAASGRRDTAGSRPAADDAPSGGGRRPRRDGPLAAYVRQQGCHWVRVHAERPPPRDASAGWPARRRHGTLTHQAGPDAHRPHDRGSLCAAFRGDARGGCG